MQIFLILCFKYNDYIKYKLENDLYLVEQDQSLCAFSIAETISS